MLLYFYNLSDTEYINISHQNVTFNIHIRHQFPALHSVTKIPVFFRRYFPYQHTHWNILYFQWLNGFTHLNYSYKVKNKNGIIIYLSYSDCFTCAFIHLVVCFTTGPKPLPKRALHIVRSRASSFK